MGASESFGVTIGLNEKGSMDMEEFAKYLCNAIMLLYPNAAPEFGKWVILKCDSGPGRLNFDLLADLRSDGFILFPGEFTKYLCNAIMPHYPNAAPEFGKWVILKCDSGPG
jgi:hypothetical protein